MDSIIRLNEKFFEDLKFQEKGHKYTLGDDILKSVSGLIPEFYEFVDWEEVAEKYAFKHKTTTSSVLEAWGMLTSVACEDGSAVHYYAEEDYKHRAAVREKEKAVDAFYASLDRQRYIFLHDELRMFHKEHLFAGTTDKILHDNYTGTDIILDWKTNKDLFKNFAGRTLLHPFADLLDCPLDKYKIQVNFYHLMYEQTGRVVSERWIVWLKENGVFEIFKSPDYTARLMAWLGNKTFIA